MTVDLRKRKPMPEPLKEAAAQAFERLMARPATPQMLVTGTDERQTFGSPYADGDADAWEALLFDAFATRNQSVLNAFLQQLSLLSPNLWNDVTGCLEPDHARLAAAVQIVRSMAPRNEAEACLAAQAVAVHFATMKLGESVARTHWPDSRTVAVLAKSARTFADILATLERLKGRRKPATRQKITVRHEHHTHTHQHVHMAGDGSKNGGRADGTRDGTIDGTCEPAERRALPGQSEAWSGAVPIPGGEGQASLSPPRGRSRVGRSTGEGE